MTQQEIFLNLKKNGKDNVLQTIDNCIFVLEHDENLRGTIRFNVLTERDCIVGDVGWERTGSAITERETLLHLCPGSLEFHRGRRHKSCPQILGFLRATTPEAHRLPGQKWKHGFPTRRKSFTVTTIY